MHDADPLTRVKRTLTQAAACINSLLSAARENRSLLGDVPMPEYLQPNGRAELERLADQIAPMIVQSALRRNVEFFRFLACATVVIAKRGFAADGPETALQVFLIILADFRIEFPGDESERVQFNSKLLGYVKWCLEQKNPVARKKAFDDFVNFLQSSCRFPN